MKTLELTPSQMIHSRHRARQALVANRLLLLMLALVAFFPMLGTRDIVTSHEARVAQTARQMAAVGWPWNATLLAVPAVRLEKIEGRTELSVQQSADMWRVNPWLIPVLNGQIRLHKPPLPYWCAAVLFKFFGTSEAAARFIPALLGAIATLLMLDLGRRLLGSFAGWCCALVWISSYFVTTEFRKAMADPYLAFFTISALWCWIRAGTGKTTLYVLGFYLSLALGILAKGPVIPLHVAIALAVYITCYRTPLVGKWMHHVAGILLLLAVTLPWAAYVYRHIPNALDLWRYESIGEFSDNTEKARSLFYYLPGLFQIALPWTPILVLGWIDALIGSGKRDRRRRFAFLWYWITVIVFSLANVKKNAYLLPMMPAQTLLVAQGLLALLIAARRVKLPISYTILILAQRILAIVFGLIVCGICWKWGRSFGSAATVVGLIAITLALFATRRKLFEHQRQWLLLLAAAYVIAIAGFFAFYNTPADNQRSARPIAHQIQAMLTDPGATLQPADLPEEVSWYLPLDLQFNPQAPRELIIIDDPRNQLTPADPRFHGKPSIPCLLGNRWKVFQIQAQNPAQ